MAWITSYTRAEVEQIRTYRASSDWSERDPYGRRASAVEDPDDVLDAVLEHARTTLRGLGSDDRRRLRARWDGDEVLIYTPEHRPSLTG